MRSSDPVCDKVRGFCNIHFSDHVESVA
jgi:hypothetical protein